LRTKEKRNLNYVAVKLTKTWLSIDVKEKTFFGAPFCVNIS